jgi:GntR family transcriptional regulator
MSMPLKITIQKNKREPVYIQLKQQLKDNILHNILEPGEKLPTEREMAEELKISRNTVSAAYKELEREGFILSTQGKGTYVIFKDSRIQLAENIVKNCLNSLLELGFSQDEFLFYSQRAVDNFLDSLNTVKAIFVECNKEQVDFFCNELENEFGAKITPIILSDLQNTPMDYTDSIVGADVIITTFFHEEEIKPFVKSNKSAPIVGIALEPKIDTIVKIAQLIRDTRLGVVCISKNFAEKVINTLKSSGLELPIKYNLSHDKNELKKFINSVDIVIVSPGRKKDLESLINSKAIIEFIFLPDSGSLKLLQNTFQQIKDQKLNNIKG